MNDIGSLESLFALPIFGPIVYGGILYWAPLTNPQKSYKIIGLLLLVGYPLLYLLVGYLMMKYIFDSKINILQASYVVAVITAFVLGPSIWGITFYNPTKDSQGNDVPPTKGNQAYGGLLIGSSVVFLLAFLSWIWYMSKKQTHTEYNQMIDNYNKPRL